MLRADPRAADPLMPPQISCVAFVVEMRPNVNPEVNHKQKCDMQKSQSDDCSNSAMHYRISKFSDSEQTNIATPNPDIKIPRSYM